MELLEQWDAFSVHAGYYIERHVNAAVQRCLGLSPYFVDVSQWFKETTKPRRRIHHWHRSSTSRSNTAMISNFFGSDRCAICGGKCVSEGRSCVSVCRICRQDTVTTMEVAMRRQSSTQKTGHALAQRCRQCNLCFEDMETFAFGSSRKSTRRHPASSNRSSVNATVLTTPIANCTCIDCPTTFERHRAAEKRLEVAALFETLQLLDDNP